MVDVSNSFFHCNSNKAKMDQEKELLESVGNNSELADEVHSVNAIFGTDPPTVTALPKLDSLPASLTLDLGINGQAAEEKRNDERIITTARLRIPSNNDSTSNEEPVSFVVGFDKSYPDSAPYVLGTASTGAARGQGKKAKAILEEIVERIHQPGAVCLFEVISEASEIFDRSGETDDDEKEDDNNLRQADLKQLQGENNAKEQQRVTTGEVEEDGGIHWIMSDVVNVKKSTFVARAAVVDSVDQAKSLIDNLLATNKKAAAATHNISAWRIRQAHAQQQQGVIFQDFDDDGETAAGGRLLHLMQLMDVWNVVVVVSRWFGGVLLGPDRFRIINNVARQALIRVPHERGP